MNKSFFALAEHSQFIQQVYAAAPSQLQQYFREEGEMLRRGLHGARCVLEIGCGFGRALDCVPEGTNYTGIDIGFGYLVEASRTRQPGKWVCADATALPFADGAFDAVFCIQNTLGNMEGIEQKVLAESFRVCNGRLLFGVYSEDSFDLRRLWYDRLVELGIFGRYGLDPVNPRIVRSDTGWSSRCFDSEELQQMLGAGRVTIRKIGALSYFCTAKCDSA